MREHWRDPLTFQILTGNADENMREIAKALDLASDRPDQGSLGLARSMTPEPPRPLFVVGAGFSHDSMPLTTELEALVTGLLAGRGIERPAELLRQDWREAWRLLSEDAARFKERFVGFSQGRPPALQHGVLSQALAARTLAGVVSFNWDDHIERSDGEFPVVNSENQLVTSPGL